MRFKFQDRKEIEQIKLLLAIKYSGSHYHFEAMKMPWPNLGDCYWCITARCKTLKSFGDIMLGCWGASEIDAWRKALIDD